MRAIKRLLRRLKMLVHRGQFDADLAEEMRIHREMMSAPKNFGNATLLREQSKDMWGWTWMEQLLRDFRFAVRLLWKKPAFAAVAVLTLALGIGANSLMFSVLYTVVLKPLPYEDPNRLVRVTRYIPLFKVDLASTPDYFDWRELRQLFQAVGAYVMSDLNLLGGESPERVRAAEVTASLFGALDVQARLGRVMNGQEDAPGGPKVAVLTHGFHARRFGGDRAVLGRQINLDDTPYTMIGVMPPSFRMPETVEPDILLPLQLRNEGRQATARVLAVIARLLPGVTIERAKADLAAIDSRIPAPAALRRGIEMRVTPLHQRMVGDVRSPMLILFGAVVVVLLITCANVGGLLLAQAADRRKKIALKAALGAGRGRVIRQLLTESLLLALAGSMLGLTLAAAGIRVLAAVAPPRIPLISEVAMSLPVLGFTFGVAILASVLFGVVPAFVVSGNALQDGLKQGSPTGSAGTPSRRFRGVLVAAELSLALVLAAGAGLLIKSLWRLQLTDPGFRPDRILSMEINALPSRYRTTPQRLDFADQVLAKVSAIPGVEAAAFHRGRYVGGRFRVVGLPTADDQPMTQAEVATPEFFRTMGVRLFKGRLLQDADGGSAQRVAVINQAFVKVYFRDRDPLGYVIGIGPTRTHTVVGVVADMADAGLGVEVTPTMYLPLAQVDHIPPIRLLVRTPGDPMALAAVVQQQVRSVERDQPVYDIQTMEQRLATSVAPRRFTMLVLSLFAAIALLLAAAGVYGLAYYAVAHMTHEIGIRMALGAQPGEVMRMILGHGLRLTMAGLAIGLLGSWAATRLLTGMLYEVSATDAFTLTAVSITLLAVATAAIYVPARRAIRVDPVVALRAE